jgi:hypothetical protein
MSPQRPPLTVSLVPLSHVSGLNPRSTPSTTVRVGDIACTYVLAYHLLFPAIRRLLASPTTPTADGKRLSMWSNRTSHKPSPMAPSHLLAQTQHSDFSSTNSWTRKDSRSGLLALRRASPQRSPARCLWIRMALRSAGQRQDQWRKRFV